MGKKTANCALRDGTAATTAGLLYSEYSRHALRAVTIECMVQTSERFRKLGIKA